MKYNITFYKEKWDYIAQHAVEARGISDALFKAAQLARLDCKIRQATKIELEIITEELAPVKLDTETGVLA